MLKPFLRVLAPDQALELVKIFDPTEIEQIPMTEGLFRVLAEPIKSTEDMPGFDRSTMDGFAVRSRDTFGSSEGAPALFQIVGEVSMGEIPDIKLKKGEAVRIWTGGALPSESDAVVMIEHSEEIGDNSLEVLKAVAPFENVVRRGEDFRKGETFLDAGFRLRPQDLGLLAAMGRQTVSVYRKPNVAVISSGDEIIPIDQEPLPGCIRDVNRYTITSMIQEAHANPLWIGIAPDNFRCCFFFDRARHRTQPIWSSSRAAALWGAVIMSSKLSDLIKIRKSCFTAFPFPRESHSYWVESAESRLPGYRGILFQQWFVLNSSLFR